MPRTQGSRAQERGQRTKAARMRAGLTQQELADRVGVGRVSIARVEAGTRRPSVDLALAIAHETGKSVEQLFGGGR